LTSQEALKASHKLKIWLGDLFGLQFPTKKEVYIPRLSRFVREVPNRIQITSPAEAARYLLQNIFAPFTDFDQEELWSLLCNTKNAITHQAMIYRGMVNVLEVRTAEVLKEAVRVNAPTLILTHAHPNSDPTPSPEDIAVSKKSSKEADFLVLKSSIT
jgi:DNA repair protein RadC